MLTIETALKLIVLSYISGLLSLKAIKYSYYLIKSYQRTNRKYSKITFETDLKDWGCD